MIETDRILQNVQLKVIKVIFKKKNNYSLVILTHPRWDMVKLLQLRADTEAWRTAQDEDLYNTMVISYKSPMS